MFLSRFVGKRGVRRGFPQHASQDEEFQLLPRSFISHGFQFLANAPPCMAEQQRWSAGVQQERMVSSSGLHQLCMRVSELLAHRSLHRRTLYSRAVPTASAAHVHSGTR